MTASEPSVGWLRTLTPRESSSLVATFVGWMLDGMDVMIFSFVMPSLIALWHITKDQAGLLGTAVLLISAVGGWIAGMAADRFGRVRVLQLTILWFAFFTFLSGFTNSFGQLLLTRSLQGLGFGGEWAVGSVLIGETIRAQHRGKAVGTVQSGWALGWGVAAIFYTLLFSWLPAETAWRIMFWIGILPAFLVFYIQGRVHEPEIYTIRKTQTKFHEIFAPGILRTTFMASLVALGAQGGYYAVTTYLPLYLQTVRHLSIMSTGAYIAVIISGAFLGYLTSAWFTDALGRRRTLILFAIGSFVVVLFYTAFPITDSVMLFLGFPLGFFSSGSFSPMGSFFTELFPTRIRASGQGFAYNFGRGFGAIFPALVGYLSTIISLEHAIAIFSAGAYLVMIAGVLALPETRGKALRE
jgi:MFS family permease